MLTMHYTSVYLGNYKLLKLGDYTKVQIER